MRPLMGPLDLSKLRAFLDEALPGSDAVQILEAGEGRAVVSLRARKEHLRPGNTVSGPTMMMLADTVAYVAILAAVGLEALAVTTSLSIDFLRKPPAGSELRASADIVKLGRGLVVTRVEISADETLVATSSVTYSRPRRAE